MRTSNTSLIQMFRVMVSRDFTLAYRHPGEWMQPVVFYVIAVSLFPFALSPDPELLRQVAPGVIWVAALFSTMLALDGLFRSDYEDGTLEQLLISPCPITVLILAKVSVHWIKTGLPLIVASPLLAVVMNLPTEAYLILVVSLLLGTPTMSLIGAIGVSLTMTVRRSSLLLTLLVVPLFIPVLIFGTGAVRAATFALDVSGQLYMMGGLLVLALSLAPITIASALKITLN